MTVRTSCHLARVGCRRALWHCMGLSRRLAADASVSLLLLCLPGVRATQGLSHEEETLREAAYLNLLVCF